MARKRRARKGKAASSAAHCEQDSGTSQAGRTMSWTMSTEGRSSDGQLSSSDVQGSDEGANTEMTSVAASIDHVDTSVSGLLDNEDNDTHETLSDSQSTYAPPSEYPTVAYAHRTERPFGEEDDGDVLSTRSITEQDLDYRWEHGRRYCGPHYHMPNDEYEQMRLSLKHRIYLDLFDGKLSTVHLEDPELILDIGTGIGEWAIGMADKFPECEVIGTDISAIQPTSVPANCFFEIDDAELEWTRESDSFDLVHFRDTVGCFMDWHFIYQEAFRVIKPGGWVELLDFDDSSGGLSMFISQFPPTSDVHALARDLPLAVEKSGRIRGVAHLNPSWLHQAGFVDVKFTEHVIPINVQAGGGKLWLIACVDGLEALALRLLTQHMGWDGERVKEACYNVAREMAQFAKDPIKSKGLNLKVRIMIGRKPLKAKSREDPAAMGREGKLDDEIEIDQ